MFRFLFAASLLMFLTACDSHGRAQTDTHWVATTSTPNSGGNLALYGFALVDSFGTDSDVDFKSPLKIDPKVDNGIFEVYWDVEASSAFYLRVGLGDKASMARSIILIDETCEWKSACEPQGGFICHYSLDGQMGCGVDLSEAKRFYVPIDSLLVHLPEYLYLNLEVCDRRNYCEVSSLPVDVY